MVRVPQQWRENLKLLEQVPVADSNGKAVPLKKNLRTFVWRKLPQQLNMKAIAAEPLSRKRARSGRGHICDRGAKSGGRQSYIRTRLRDSLGR